MKFNIRAGVPEGYESDAGFAARARESGARIEVFRDAAGAARGADVVITDTWSSMGQPHMEAKMAAMQPFRVNGALMSLAKPDALFMHCLPAHRGDEVTDEVLDGLQSVVFDEAENRLHVQKAILCWVFGIETLP